MRTPGVAFYFPLNDVLGVHAPVAVGHVGALQRATHHEASIVRLRPGRENPRTSARAREGGMSGIGGGGGGGGACACAFAPARTRTGVHAPEVDAVRAPPVSGQPSERARQDAPWDALCAQGRSLAARTFRDLRHSTDLCRRSLCSFSLSTSQPGARLGLPPPSMLASERPPLLTLARKCESPTRSAVAEPVRASLLASAAATVLHPQPIAADQNRRSAARGRAAAARLALPPAHPSRGG